MLREFHHGDLPSQTPKPDEEEHSGHSVELMMYNRVLLIDLEDERIVDTVSSEDLDGESSCKEEEDDRRQEVVRVDASVELAPCRSRTLLCWSYQEKDEESCEHQHTATVEAQQVRVFLADMVRLVVELDARLALIALAEDVSVEHEQVIRQDLQFFGHLPFQHLEASLVNDVAELLVKRVILEHQEVLQELFHDLPERQLVDLTE